MHSLIVSYNLGIWWLDLTDCANYAVNYIMCDAFQWNE